MNHTNLTVLYVNRRFRQDRQVPPGVHTDVTNPPSIDWEADDLRQDVEVLRETFAEGSLGPTIANHLLFLVSGC